MLLFNDSDGASRFNASWDLKVDVARPSFFTLSKIRSKPTSDYDKELFRSVVDPCQKKDWFAGFFTKIAAESLQKFTNFRIECPTQKGFYYFTNFPMYSYDVKKIFPFASLPKDPIEFKYTTTIYAKITKKNQMVKEKILMVEVYGVHIFI
jgi:Protein of unknown function (DUF1091)